MLFEIRQFFGQVRSTWRWVGAGFGAPYPHYMKQATLRRYSLPASIFIETGTYKGSTSRYFAKRGFKVVTIEVHKPLFDTYSPALRKMGVDARLGDSGVVLSEVFAHYATSSAFTIFLDGHFSGGITGTGDEQVPVVKEFDLITTLVASNPTKSFSIIIDDVRLFMPGGDPFYPAKITLIDFAKSISADWRVENDMFVCERPAKR